MVMAMLNTASIIAALGALATSFQVRLVPARGAEVERVEVTYLERSSSLNAPIEDMRAAERALSSFHAVRLGAQILVTEPSHAGLTAECECGAPGGFGCLCSRAA